MEADLKEYFKMIRLKEMEDSHKKMEKFSLESGSLTNLFYEMKL